MPYKSIKDANSAIRGIKPPVSLEQANHIADMADSIDAEKGWPIAMGTFKREFTVRNGRWVKRQDIQEAHAQETIRRLAQEWNMQLPVTTQEAITLKAHAKQVLADLNSILALKGVSAKLRKEVEDVKAELKKNWADLADIVDNQPPVKDEKPEDDEEEDDETKPTEGGAPVTASTEAPVAEEPEEVAEEGTMMKKGSESYPYSDFLVCGDEKSPTSWHLQVKKNGKVDHTLMGGAWAALHGGYRGNKYEGPDKAAALSKLKALYKAENMPMPGMAEAISEAIFELDATLAEVIESYSVELSETVETEPVREAEIEYLEETVLVESLNEDSTERNYIQLDEAAGVTEVNDVVPLRMDVAFIYPGFGNKRDNHYYPAATLRRDSAQFKGLKMYESDHRASEKSTRTWVSTIEEVTGFTPEGAPIAKVVVHEPNFARRVRALSAAGQLNKLECSILASGKARKGKVEGKEAKIVEEITDAESVDWVTRAGAGGKALQLSESVQNTEKEVPMTGQEGEQVVEPTEETPAPTEAVTEAVPEILAETVVLAELGKVRIPEATKTKLAKGSYTTVEELTKAVEDEVAYLKEATASGKPFEQSGEPKPTDTKLTEAEYESKMAAIGEKYGIGIYHKEANNA